MARKDGQGSERRQRSEQHRIRLTAAERTELNHRAELAGLSVAAYVSHRAIGTEGPRSMRSAPLPAERAVRDLLGQLGYVGNNLNQLTRAVNMGDLEEPRELASVLTRLYDLQDAFHALLPRRP